MKNFTNKFVYVQNFLYLCTLKCVMLIREVLKNIAFWRERKEYTMKIPFKVSARTARLIGRENVASAKGAIIELVKNGYDADSECGLIYIDNRYSVFSDKISKEFYEELVSKGIDTALLACVYEATETGYVMSQNADKADVERLIAAQQATASLYIIDNGDGMTRQIIEDYWMTIGTDNKARNFVTRKGRIKVGAKGIGRFALDKLGQKCQMITIYDPEVHTEQSEYAGYVWNVDWNDFEGVSQTLDLVNADIEGTVDGYMTWINRLQLPEKLLKNLKTSSSHGTILHITHLRDVWTDALVLQLYDDLGVLVPPAEQPDYAISLVSSRQPEDYGEVETAFCDDYDYKIEAHADDNQNVSIKISRREYDVDSMPLSFFLRPHQQNYPYRKEDFDRGEWKTSRTFAQLVPGYKGADVYDVLSHIGAFDFTFYFLKRGTSKADETRFFYKRNPYGLRGQWLDKFGGIKIFRDSFRVRPYGERGSSSYDWLELGSRKQKSPAGVAKKDGGYRVEVENVAGSISISRLNNIEFDDKSSREGLQESPAFGLFKKILQGIISIFEDDRAVIARELDADDRARNGSKRDMEQAELLARRILENKRNGKSESGKASNLSTKVGDEHSDSQQHSLELLATLNEQKAEEIRRLQEEQLMLRALASTGLMLASFGHDLNKLYNVLNDRHDKIRNLIIDKIPESEYQGVPEWRNPYYLIESAKKTDTKMQNWLNFATNVIRRDKRKRRLVRISAYFDALQKTWNGVFESRGIKFSCDGADDIQMRIFEIDLDSIFYNLFSNSVEAFVYSREDREREIGIRFSYNEKYIVCDYSDSGPGLSPDIANPEDIFKPFFTTKRNSNGEETGTGLGMWIVRQVATDNDAQLQITKPAYGFGLQIKFPIKYKQNIA